MRRVDREPDAAAGSGGPCALCTARPDGHGGEPRADLRVDSEQEAGGGTERAGAGCEDGVGRVPAQARGRRVSGGADGGDGRGRGNTHRGADDGHGPAAGTAAGNWIEMVECVELLRGERPAESEDLRELSLQLAGWMIHLGGKAATPEAGYELRRSGTGGWLGAGALLQDGRGAGRRRFGLRRSAGFHKPGATQVVEAWESGFVAEMDTTALGWAVQRTGAGREKAGEPVDPHAGIVFHARRGARVEKGPAAGHPLCDRQRRCCEEPAELIRGGDHVSRAARGRAADQQRVDARKRPRAHLRDAVR